MKIVAFARGRIVALLLLLGVLAAAGAFAVSRLPSAIFPSVTFPLVKVIADVGEEPAARMMPTVTRPLEEAILRVPGVELVRSTTSRGSTEIGAQFAWGTDMEVARQRVQSETERIRPDLPPDTRVDVEWMNPAVFPIQGYALTSKTRSQAELWDLAEYTLKPALIRIPGVSQVQIQGGRQREFQVRLDRQALEGRQLAVGDVVDAVRQQADVLSAGLTERNHELYLALVNGRVHGLESLARIAVPTPNGPPATLGELGQVRSADEVSYVATTANGDSAVLVNVVRQPSANTVAIARGVDQLFRDQPHLLPPDVRWTNFYDQARFVSDSVSGARDAILIGIALAALVLFVFLRKWRLTLIAVLAIPLTVAIVGLFLGLLGQTINLMTLAGVAAALGLIADDAIVMIENIDRHESQAAAPDGASGSGADPAVSGAAELRPALIGSSLSTIVILLPFAVLSGVAGAFFKPLALTMALALAISFAIALLAVPAAVSRFGFAHADASVEPSEPDGHGWRERLAGWWKRHAGGLTRGWHSVAERGARGYERLTELFVTRGIASVAVLALLIGGAYLLYRGMGTDFLPAMDEGSIILDYWTPPGTSLSETDAMLREAERVIQATPGVAGYSRRTGAELGFFITEPNAGDYVIKLEPRGQRRGVEPIIAELRARIAAVEPAIHTDFGQLLEDNIGDLTGGAPQPVDVKIFGDDPDRLRQKAEQAAAILGKVSGVEDVFDGIVIAGPALQVEVDPLAAARYGLNTQSIHAAVEPAVTGTVVDRMRVGEKLYDLRVFAQHNTPLADLTIRGVSPPTALLPLSAVARITTGAPEAQIARENLKTYVGVTARLNGRDLGGAISEIQRRLGSGLALGPTETIRYGGAYQQQQQSFRGLLYVLLAGLLLVSVVVLWEFGDWRAPIVTSLSAVAVLTGVLGALELTGQTLNISSYVGAIMMVGIVGENAIFVIHEARLALLRGCTPHEAWSEAAHRRLRPVLMTVLATTFALTPLALALGQGAQLMQPLAIAVIGGFVLSGPIVLLVLPGLYRLLDPHGRLAPGS